MNRRTHPSPYDIALLASMAMTGAAFANEDGSQHYQEFKCASCHGISPSAGPAAGTPRLWGMDRIHIAKTTKKMVEKLAHAEALGSSCGEPPTDAQIASIAEWISRQAR